MSSASPAPAARIATQIPAAATSLRRWLAERRAGLKAAYFEKPDPRGLLAAHAKLVDEALVALWKQCAMPPGWALIAVGGYGRAGLFPHSDIDVLILVPEGEASTQAAEPFVGLLWDCGLEPGHSVRSIAQCIEEAERDVTVMTSLLETRLITGRRELFAALQKQVRKHLKPREFFQAKFEEQRKRHTRALDAAFKLEPNIKEGPGGLRDLQTIHWVSDAAACGAGWRKMTAEGLITAAEARRVARDERTLQDLRIRLHYLAGRREDRLIFDHQTSLAQEMGIAGSDARRPSEELMQRYYRTAKSVYCLNTILLQNIWARIAPPRDNKLVPIDARFAKRGNALEILDENLFAREPTAIFEAARLLQQHLDLAGVSADALRALWRALPKINRAFRNNPVNRRLFMDILSSPKRVTFMLRHMHLHGVLARYLPEFGRIVGQMQHDLFHVYTVDEHILMVARNLRRFMTAEYAHEFPQCSELIGKFERPEVLIVAALYHDIAKGRGGDHSALGAHDARRFCRTHGLAPADAELVVWLVQNHLVMSATAQKQDLSDPDVIAAFAARVEDERRLIALYLLTVADIRGTSPHVWNAWKAKLLEDLLRLTRTMLHGERAPAKTWSEAKRSEALRIFRNYVPEAGKEKALWDKLDTSYFQRFEASEIAWHTRVLWSRPASGKAIVKARLSPIGEGLQVMIYTPDQEGLFARICGFFERVNLDIASAKIHTTGDDYALDTFQLMSRSGEQGGLGGHYRDVIATIEEELGARIREQRPLEAPLTGRLSRQVRHFPIEPVVTISPEPRGRYFNVAIVAADRPGLLSSVARCFYRHGISLHDARITTLGKRAEDIFIVEGEKLARADDVRELENDLLEALRT